MKVVLSIAGSDSSGGAGIQADIKTIISNGCYAETAITALTAQNTLGVRDILNVSPEFLENELDAIFEDIKPDAIKIGMVSDKNLIKSIVKKLKQYDAKNIVVDPVMVATSGSKLLSDDAINVLINELIPLADIITPNIPEAEVLSGIKINNVSDMEHMINDANDLLYSNNELIWINGKRINNTNTHGTGCTLSSAIASNLAKGYDIKTSIVRSKYYLSNCLSQMLDLGKGSGPMDHGWNFKEIEIND